MQGAEGESPYARRLDLESGKCSCDIVFRRRIVTTVILSRGARRARGYNRMCGTERNNDGVNAPPTSRPRAAAPLCSRLPVRVYEVFNSFTKDYWRQSSLE